MNTERSNAPEHRIIGRSGKLQDLVDLLSLQQYRTLIETELDGLGMFDGEDVFLYTNRKLREMLGVSTAEVLGRPAADHMEAGSVAAWQHRQRSGKTGADSRFELVWARKDGTSVKTSVDAQGIFDGDGLCRGTLAVVTPLGEAGKAKVVPSAGDLWQRGLVSDLLGMQELERRRISRELHDEVGQALTAIKLNAGLMARTLPEGMHQLRLDCGDLISSVDLVIDHVRRLARELSPSILEDVGLSAALRALLQDFARGGDLKITAAIGNIDHLLPKKAEITVYRIIQEALLNAKRHARANNVVVIGGREGSRLSFVVEDDGIGFNAGLVLRDAAHRGLGLPLISERVRVLGGSLDLDSEIGVGTKVRFVIPIDDGERQ